MKVHYLPVSLFIFSALAACQSTAPEPDPDRGVSNDSYDGTNNIDTDTNGTTGSNGFYDDEDSVDAASSRQDPQPVATQHVTASGWGAGTKHISFGGSFTDDQTEDNLGPDIETLDVQATFGVLLTERVEVNGEALYHEQEAGENDVNRVGLLGGLRYHIVVPTTDDNIGVYAEAKAGVVSVDRTTSEETEFVYGASGGVLWFPWGVEAGMALDVAIDWLTSDTTDHVGGSLALAYYW